MNDPETDRKIDDMKTEGRFDQVKGKIRSTWGQLTDDDIDQAKGNLESLIGKIKERTGETVESIRERINRMTSHNDEHGNHDERRSA